MEAVRYVFVGCLISYCSATLIEWSAEDYPNPQEDPAACGRSGPSYICDPNRIIDTDSANFLDHILLNMQNDTKCPCSTYFCERKPHSSGYIIAVALVKKMKRPEGVPNTVESRTVLVQRFAYDLLKKHWTWGNCDEMTLIVYSRDDGILVTLSGNTPRRLLTESIATYIETEMSRFFIKEDTIGNGLHYLVMNYRRVLEGRHYLPLVYTNVPSKAPVLCVSIVTSIISTLLLRLLC